MRASLDLLLFLCWTGEASPLDDALGFEATQPSVLLQLFAREALANLRLRFAQGRCGQFAASPERPDIAGPRVYGERAMNEPALAGLERARRSVRFGAE